MGRRRVYRDTKPLTARIEATVADRFDLLLHDPVSKRGAYGRKGPIIEELIRRLIDAAVHNSDTIPVADLVKQLR